MDTLLIISLAIMCGLVILFVFLGIGRLFTKRDESEQFHALIDSLTKSEIDLERQDANIPDPKTWTGYWWSLANRAGQNPENQATPGYFAVGAMLFLAAIGILVWPGDIFGGIIFAVASLIGLRMYFVMKIKGRLVLMDKQLPNLLSGIRANLQANLTPQQAIVSQAKEIPAPLGQELKILTEEMNVGVSLDVALRNFGQRIPSREIQFLVAAFRVAIRSGAELDPLIATIQRIVVQRQRIANALASAVASVQPALWVTAIMIPAAFLWSFYSSEDNRNFWLTPPIGIIAFIVCAVCYAAGLFIAKKQIDKVKDA